jgi:uncharacterized protein (DUF1015 family)
MPLVVPFRAMRFDPQVVGPLESVTAPPYDVINEERRRELLTASRWSVVHLDLADGHHDPDHAESRYARAASLLDRWLDEGAVRVEGRPAYWAYEMAGDSIRIRGVICALELEPWGSGVLPHERTMPGPIHDRLALLRALRTHLSPVYGTVAGPVEPLEELLEQTAATSPDGEVTDPDGVRHRTWRLTDDVPIDEWLADLPLLIADGHHRYETALRYRDERRGADGPGSWDRVLTLVVDAGVQDVPVLPFHRVLATGPLPADGDEVSDPLIALAALDDADVAAVAVCRSGDQMQVRVLRMSGEPPSVRALHAIYLARVEPASIAYTPEAAAAVEEVRAGRASAAYLLPPTTPDAVRAVVADGHRLPAKSTLFWPKPRTGMVMMHLDPDEAGLTTPEAKPV